MHNGRQIVVGVAAGIAAYKVPGLVRLLRADGHFVRVIPTTSSLEFVGRATWEAISGQDVTTSVFDGVTQVDHVRLGKDAEAIIVAPATADLLARAASGRADDLLTATLLVARCPVIFAPAMHTEMWEHPATQANVRTLRERGAIVLEPGVGKLTGADVGAGRMPEIEELHAAVVGVLDGGLSTPRLDLLGKRVVVTAGGTREPLDPVRFLGNLSSGRQGVALAQAALSRGASVTLIASHLEVPSPVGVELVEVGTALEMRDAVVREVAEADLLIMTAAVADFRPAYPESFKIKKDPNSDDAPVIELVRNPDILAGIAHDRPHPALVVVGFAAETGGPGTSVIELGVAKAKAKGADLMVINAVGGGHGFGTSSNTVTIVDSQGNVFAEATGSKADIAHEVLDAVTFL